MRRVQPQLRAPLSKFCCNIERGVHMTRQIRNFLNISCFPNFRGDLQGMSGPQSHITVEGQCLHFGKMLPQRPVKGGRGRAGRKAKAKCTSFGARGGDTPGPVNSNSGKRIKTGRPDGSGAGTSKLLGVSFLWKIKLLHGRLNCVSSKQKQNKKLKSQNIVQEVVFFLKNITFPKWYPEVILS